MTVIQALRIFRDHWNEHLDEYIDIYLDARPEDQLWVAINTMLALLDAHDNLAPKPDEWQPWMHTIAIDADGGKWAYGEEPIHDQNAWMLRNSHGKVRNPIAEARGLQE